MESFDLMQNFFGSSSEQLIHGLFRFSGHLDIDALKKAVTLSAKAVPLVFCKCCLDGKTPYWEQLEYTGENIVQLIETSEEEEDTVTNNLLSTSIDINMEPQLKMFVVRMPERDTLCTIMNHMVTDGSGFKEYMYLLSSLYTYCLGESTQAPDLSPRPRNTKPLYENYTLFEKLKILFAKFDLSALKKQAPYKFEGDPSNPIFARYTISKEHFADIKAYSKKNNATVNDIFLAAYARVLSKTTGSRRVVLPCPVDLRKYKTESLQSVSNLTGSYLCDLDIREESPFEDTLMQVSRQLNSQKQSKGCIKSVMSMEIVFHLLPFQVYRRIFKNIFTTPLVSYSNVGVISKDMLRFGKLETTFAYLTGALKNSPYIQLVFSTFDEGINISCNIFGTRHDKEEIYSFLEQIAREITDIVKKD
jgi:NRPS condensation-like uncharacterized protein